MGQIVGAFIVPHDPLIFVTPDAAPADQKERVLEGFAKVSERIGALQATAAIVIGADHYVLFGPGCLPRYLIGTGDVWGPVDRLPGIKQGVIASNPFLARHIMQTGFDEGFDWSIAKSLKIDHAIGIPVRLCLDPVGTIPVIPIYLASGVDPMISSKRAHELGGLIKRAVETYADDERVVVIGSGGISHWLGLAEMGRVNTTFDEMVLRCVVEGAADELIALSDEDILNQGGNGGFEIRNFLCAMGTVPGATGEVLAYEAVPAWITGLGFAQMRPQ